MLPWIFYLSFIHSSFGFYPNIISQRQSSFTVRVKNNQPVVDLSFDFSSQDGWDRFYTIHQENSFEWHSSIPHSFILDEIDRGSNVLLVGTGNSHLPRILYDHHEHSTQVICMDYSNPCIETLKELHEKDCPQMKFLCGDVMHLTMLMKDHFLDHSIIDDDLRTDCKYLEYVIDKGLMDALMCNEGFCFTLEKYIRQIASVLKKNGKLILISYKLIPSTREFLETQGDKFGMKWEFDISEKSNDRVSYSVATLQC
jgi:SAM-dependent methyltransferase